MTSYAGTRALRALIAAIPILIGCGDYTTQPAAPRDSTGSAGDTTPPPPGPYGRTAAPPGPDEGRVIYIAG